MTKEPNSKKMKCLSRPHNCYNIFFILERERLIQQAKEESSSHNGANDVASNSGEGSASYDLVGYESLNLPDLPPRYRGLSMETGWYVPGKNARRKHVKTHGLTSFADLAQTVANNWKTVDDVTKEYCQTVARIIRERHAVLSRTKGFYAPKKKAKNSAKNTTDGRKSLKTRRLTMPDNIVPKKNLIGEKVHHRSLSVGDKSPSSTKPCLPYMNIGLPLPVLYPVTPELATSSYSDLATRILQMDDQRSNISNAMPQEQRRSSMPNLLASPSPSSSVELGLPIVCSSVQEPNKVNQDMGIIAPPSSKSEITEEKNLWSSLPNLQTSTSLNYPISAEEFNFTMICPPTSDCSRGARSNEGMVPEVDISDSAIHDMWSADDI